MGVGEGKSSGEESDSNTREPNEKKKKKKVIAVIQKHDTMITEMLVGLPVIDRENEFSELSSNYEQI